MDANYNQNSGYGRGIINMVSSVVPSFGRIFVVCPAGDVTQEFYQRMQELMKTVSEVRFFETVAEAYAATTTNNDDVILMSSDGTHELTEMLDISKDRVHFVGMNCGAKRRLGPRTKLSIGVTTAATDIATVKITGVGVTFHNIKVISNNTVAESLYTVADGGEYTYFENCEFYKSTDLDVTGAAELLCNGDSSQYVNCSFGSTANIIADNVIRPNVLFTATLAGKKARDVQFKGCLFLSKAGGTEHVAMYGANATDIERMLLVEDSVFINNALSAATPAHAVGFGAAQTEGSVLLKNCTSVDHTVMAQAAVGIYVDGAVPTFATSGVAVAS